MHQIRYFVAVAQTLNFTRAAEQCGVTQPALTRAIQKLEEELGGPLFRREGRQSHLTELGRMVRPRLEQALSLTDLARSEAVDFSRMVNGTLDLGVMCTIAPASVISLIEFFSRQAPQLKLVLHEATGRRLAEKLIAGELDIALIAMSAYDDALIAEPLFSEPYVITFPKGHRFLDMDAVPVAELAGERYLKRVNCEYLDIFEAEGFEYHYGTDHRFQSEHESWIQAMVIAGLGCAVMPQSLALHPELRHRLLVEPKVERTISIVTKRGRRHTPVVEFFVKLCRKMHWGSPENGIKQTLPPNTEPSQI